MDKRKIEMLLGKRIRQLRKKQGLTQEKASEKTWTISEKRWSDIERGMYAIGLTTLINIAKGLNVPFQELFRFEGTNLEKTKNKFLNKSLSKMEKQVNKIEGQMANLKKEIRNLKKSLD